MSCWESAFLMYKHYLQYLDSVHCHVCVCEREIIVDKKKTSREKPKHTYHVVSFADVYYKWTCQQECEERRPEFQSPCVSAPYLSLKRIITKHQHFNIYLIYLFCKLLLSIIHIHTLSLLFAYLLLADIFGMLRQMR